MAKSMLTALPLGEADTLAFIQCANSRFEYVLARVEPDNPDVVRRLWNAQLYIDEVVREDMLPIDRDEALGLVEAFLVGHVANLAAQADELAGATRH